MIARGDSAQDCREPAIIAPLQDPDQGVANPRGESLPESRIGYHVGAVERRAEHSSVGHLAADPAADAAVENRGDRVSAQRVRDSS